MTAEVYARTVAESSGWGSPVLAGRRLDYLLRGVIGPKVEGAVPTSKASPPSTRSSSRWSSSKASPPAPPPPTCSSSPPAAPGARALALGLLAEQLAALAAAGDAPAARVLHEAVGRLLALDAPGPESRAAVVDLAAERARRGGR